MNSRLRILILVLTTNASLVDSVPFVKKLFAGHPVAGNCATLKAPPISD